MAENRWEKLLFLASFNLIIGALEWNNYEKGVINYEVI